MVVQIPIFYALYVALSVSVELQSQPFICFGRIFGMDIWICDLAAQDPTYVLPLLMGASMFIQQKMTPVMGDPRQAKMMMFMPVVFTFMFLNLPSGLVLYWTLSNVLQIAQQKYIEHISKKPEMGKLEKGPRVPKKA
jgi:YidC/Oxa1 family membrane protein insertase